MPKFYIFDPNDGNRFAGINPIERPGLTTTVRPPAYTTGYIPVYCPEEKTWTITANPRKETSFGISIRTALQEDYENA